MPTQGTRIAILSGKRSGIGSTIQWKPFYDPKNWYATPVLDGWGWDDYWDCEDWVTWHKANVAMFNTDFANTKFIEQWKKQDSFANPYNWCKYNTTTANYFKAQKSPQYPNGIDIGWALSNLVVGTNNVANSVANSATNLGTAVENLSTGISNTTKLTTWLLPIGLLAAGYIAYTRAKSGKTIVEYKGKRILR